MPKSNTKPPSRLGKGLSALVGPRSLSASEIAPSFAVHPHREAGEAILQIPLDLLRPNPHQPRTHFHETALKELAESIRANGVLQPVVVRPVEENHYELVAGERRWRAAKLANLKAIPAIVRALTDAQSFELALIENLQREDLTALERAEAYQHYLDTFGGTIEDLATKVAESRANISNYLRLLKLQPDVRELVGTEQLGMGQARAVAGILEPERQRAIARLAVRRNLSVRQVEELIRSGDASEGADNRVSRETRHLGTIPRHLIDVERALSRELGMRVKLHAGRKKNSGRIVITFSNLAEFDLIAHKLGGTAILE